MTEVPAPPPDLTILHRYSVDPHAYGYCDTTFDYWKYGETDFTCPYECGHTLRTLTPQELAAALAKCENDDSFQYPSTYPTPLRPTPRNQATAP
jgi:hypothetical protein